MNEWIVKAPTHQPTLPSHSSSSSSSSQSPGLSREDLGRQECPGRAGKRQEVILAHMLFITKGYYLLLPFAPHSPRPGYEDTRYTYTLTQKQVKIEAWTWFRQWDLDPRAAHAASSPELWFFCLKCGGSTNSALWRWSHTQLKEWNGIFVLSCLRRKGIGIHSFIHSFKRQ